ncbi:MAG TPA: DNA-3-methyladenine glycosylase [Mycobacteriales bacterium]|nr:DNA-3-methyladenine glycosylase [Mycobacteriales bacterium]
MGPGREPAAHPEGATDLFDGPQLKIGNVLPRAFYDRPVLEVAPDLLGRHLRSRTADGTVVVRIVEVEAYRGADDPGSHAFRGQTPRNATMFGPPGHAYVYFTYGMHWCLNVVCGPAGEASAVLIRAGSVVTGADVATARRPASSARDLARGPARLTRALGIDGTWDGTDLVRGVLTVHIGETTRRAAVSVGPRVGVSGPGAATPWRFWVDDPAVSTYRPGVVRRRNRSA